MDFDLFGLNAAMQNYLTTSKDLTLARSDTQIGLDLKQKKPTEMSRLFLHRSFYLRGLTWIDKFTIRSSYVAVIYN
jgi:hypothetical protein